ncbi:MAG: DUF58 domain-containing protein [Planctomycetota bacterium]
MKKIFDENFQKKIEYLSFVAQRLHRTKAIRKREKKRVDTGLEFADRRNYETGDDLRYIDWNCYARMERLLVRLFEEEEELRIYFLLDVSDSMWLGNPPKIDYVRQLCAALAFIGLGNLDKVGFWLFSDRIINRFPLGKGKAKIHGITNFLESAKKGGHSDFNSAILQFLSETERPGLAVVASDFLSVDSKKGLKTLAYNRFNPFLLHIYDKEEDRPTYLYDVKLLDVETGKTQNVSVTPQVRDAYIAEFKIFEQELEKISAEISAVKIAAETTVPFDKLVLSALERGLFVK